MVVVPPKTAPMATVLRATIADHGPTTATPAHKGRAPRRVKGKTAKAMVPVRPHRGKGRVGKTPLLAPPGQDKVRAKGKAAATTATVPPVKAAGKVRGATAIVRKAKGKAAAITAIALPDRVAGKVKAAVLALRERGAAIAVRVRRLLLPRRALLPDPNHKIRTPRSSRWADATVATRGAANIAATTVRDAASSSGPSNARKPRSPKPT